MVPIAATALGRNEFGDVIFAGHLDYGRLQPSDANPDSLREAAALHFRAAGLSLDNRNHRRPPLVARSTA